MLGVTLALLVGCWRSRSGRGRARLARPVVVGIYSKLPLSLAMGEIAVGYVEQLPAGRDPVLRPARRDPAALRDGGAMYNALVLWVPWLPGGLMHSNIAACAMFAATSGSSVATRRRSARSRSGESEKRGYSERLFLGTIAAGGTLGILIPPSINMIVYGVLTETVDPETLSGGFIPASSWRACSA
jgi:hypothetical protein